MQACFITDTILGNSKDPAGLRKLLEQVTFKFKYKGMEPMKDVFQILGGGLVSVFDCKITYKKKNLNIYGVGVPIKTPAVSEERLIHEVLSEVGYYTRIARNKDDLLQYMQSKEPDSYKLFNSFLSKVRIVFSDKELDIFPY